MIKVLPLFVETTMKSHTSTHTHTITHLLLGRKLVGEGDVIGTLDAHVHRAIVVFELLLNFHLAVQHTHTHIHMHTQAHWWEESQVKPQSHTQQAQTAATAA